MVVETQVKSILEWLLPNIDAQSRTYELGFILSCLGLVALLCVFGFLFGLMVAALRHGPTEGLNVVARQIFDAFASDFPGFSIRRTLAIAHLIVIESVRRSALVAFVVFVVILLFAGLFLDTTNSNPALLYLSIIYFTINLLLMLMGLFLATFSLPADIKNKTIYTIVTKPVRAIEIIVGRILGFGFVGTVVLILMGLCSFIFVWRGMSHTHTLTAQSFSEVPEKGREGLTSTNSHHQHKVTIDRNDKITVEEKMGHTHEVTVNSDGTFTVGPAEGALQARVPIYGKMIFKDRTGKETDRGINVGDEWEYRSHIEGGTAAEVVWTFSGITPERFPDGLPIEMTIQVFRTYKGNIERGILGEILIRNPDPASRLSSAPIPFESKEFAEPYSRVIPRKLKPLSRDQAGESEIDLFNDLVSRNGQVEIVLRCAEPAQYFGAAQADLYIRAGDNSFGINFLKGCLGIWLQMMMVICFGVMFSTFLNGPVAMLSTFSIILVGFFQEFVRGLASGQVEGGGPVESIIRIVTQANVQVDLEGPAFVVSIVKGIDWVAIKLISLMTYFVPDYNYFSTSGYVENGYDIPFALIVQQLLTGLAYIVCSSLVAYFCLKTREIAA